MTAAARLPCEYGVAGHTCGRTSCTWRPRPNGGQRWAVCQFHADFLDRLRANIVEHSALLAKLASS